MAIATTAAARPAGIGFGNVLRSEWTKLRSVRSTYWTIAFAVLATVALGALICVTYVNQYNQMSPKEHVGFDSTLFSLNGIYIAQLAFGTLGVLAITAEYTTGMIRTTLAAVPQRRAVLAAKTVVFGLAALLCGEVLSFAAFGIGQAILARRGAGASITDPGVLRAVVGGGLYLSAVGLLGLSIGALVRHTAGAVAALFGVLFAGSVIAALLPTSWHDRVMKFMPANALSQIITVVRTGAPALSPWGGFGIFCLYTAVVFAAATVLLVRRDA